MLQKKVVQKVKTCILRYGTFFFENRAVYEIMWENIKAGEATDDNMAHAH
jgi:hypothetical protein